MIIVQDKDIDNEERILKIKFDDSRRNALKEMNNTDIVACAGSGKTTLMCAKIDILTKKQPFVNKKGMVVLSLTNVAIEQIREKLGRNHKIFEYPNYCETIQKFVSRFILNNWFNLNYKNKIEVIDNDLFVEQIKAKIDFRKRSYLEKVNFKFEELYTDGQIVFYGNSKLEEKQIGKLKEKNMEYINIIKKAKLELISKGVFNFRDAFAISTKYLKENITLKNYIKERFEIVFVDEMQDCRKWEKEFLDECFSNVVFQKIGDPNQQIYEDTYWMPSKKCVNIKDSLRNSNNIADFASNFQEDKTGIIGRKENKIKVKFIVYPNDKILDVKDKFVEEIKKEKLDKINNAVFKIIGKVSKPNDNKKIELIDFFDNIDKNKVTKSYDIMFSRVLKQNKNELVKTIIDMMYYVYKKIDKNNYVKINDKKDFIEKVSKYINTKDIYIKLKNKNTNIVEFSKQYIEGILENIVNGEYLNKIYEHIINETNDLYSNVKQYVKNSIKVEICTIAGVKGETHTATLVCETFYKNYDIEYILNNYIKQNNVNKTIKDFLHSLYVAFTRPTDMLCIAIRKEAYDKLKNEIENLNVEIIHI